MSETDGVWVTYHYEYGPQINRVYAEEIEALRSAVESGYLVAGFLPFGKDASEVLT